ncbi:hypothetical protein [Sphingorhabdus sp. Alg231-15]|uniref:hypothetical protein n=1 Tax=Sphingorhabdus sp. Alg231-15 TaxID=1922222 RepID=UPI00307C19B1
MNFVEKEPSKLILGSMRLLESDWTLKQWVEFFVKIHGLGIEKIHSSMEYESFDLFRAIIQMLNDERPDVCFDHIVKIGNPHFDEASFQYEKLLSSIQSYCTALNTDKIGDLQWMWRSNLNDDEKRISLFQKETDAIAKAAETLKREGLIDRVLCFPYSPAFAFAAVEADGIDGLAVYRNINEPEYEPALARCGELGKDAIIIRPFAAGSLVNGEKGSPKSLFDESLDMPAIEAAIVSSSNLDHIAELVH